MNSASFLIFSIFLLLCQFASSQDVPAPAAPTDSKLICAREIFQSTIDELTEFSGSQLENLQNITPATRRKLKRALMDVLSTLGLLLEFSTSSTVSLGAAPMFVMRASKLMDRLNHDLENLRPETELLSEQLKEGLFGVMMDLPMKTFRCLSK